jgi:hypothetical protein
MRRILFLTPEKQAEAFDLLLSPLFEAWVILCELYAGEHASTALLYENEIHQQRYKDGTSIEDHFSRCNNVSSLQCNV